MRKLKAKTYIVIFVIMLLGFLREYLFVNINWIYKTLVEGRRNSARREFYALLEWTPNCITILKYLLSIIFILLFLGITYWIINTIFQSKLYNKIVLFTFISLIGAATLFQFLGYFLDSFLIYGIVRTLMGYAQSFIPLFILGITFYFIPKLKQKG